MANIKSQIKRNKQNEKAHQRNKAVKSSLRTSVRKFREAADGGNAAEAETALRAACRQLDKAASKGVIHKNQAANRKSAIAKRYAELQPRPRAHPGAGPPSWPVLLLAGSVAPPGPLWRVEFGYGASSSAQTALPAHTRRNPQRSARESTTRNP